MSTPLRLLIVCLGNICRSPMAEGALQARLADAGLAGDVVVDSAGLGHWHAGRPPDPRAVACAARHGVDISHLRARQLRRQDSTAFDWLLCADHDVLSEVRAAIPARAPAQASLLLEYAGIDAAPVPDPYTGTASDFEHVWGLVDAAAEAIVRSRSAQVAD